MELVKFVSTELPMMPLGDKLKSCKNFYFIYGNSRFHTNLEFHTMFLQNQYQNGIIEKSQNTIKLIQSKQVVLFFNKFFHTYLQLDYTKNWQLVIFNFKFINGLFAKKSQNEILTFLKIENNLNDSDLKYFNYNNCN